MPSRVTLSMRGDFIPFHTFTSAIGDLSELLYEIDMDISGIETLQWGIRKLKATDNAIEAVPRVIKKSFEDNSHIIVPTLLKGLRLIRQKPARPHHFNDDALDSAKDLTNSVNGYIHQIAVNGTTNGKLGKPIILTHRISEHVETVIGPRYKTVGSVEGTLDMISIRKPSRFGIRHAITGRSVKCRFSDAMIEQVKAGLGQRVNASGIVYYNAQDEPVRVDVEWLRVLGDKLDLPQASEIGGSDPDFTDELSTEDYMRSLRG